MLVVALGCEQVDGADAGRGGARAHGKPAEIVADPGRRRHAARHRRRASASREALAGQLARASERESCDVATLVLSLKCGGSDYTSGLASNPALGRVADRLVDLGGSAVLGEIAEIMGAEHLLAARATRPAKSAEAAFSVIDRVEIGGARRSASTSAARSRRPATSAAG